MKPPRVYVLFSIFLSLLSPTLLVAADALTTAAGYWEGNISTPNQPLAIAVELVVENDSAWQGTIDIPMQGVRGFKLSPVKVDGATVKFGMPGVPGEPVFSGQLDATAKTISGDFSQGGGRMPFQLERKVKPAPRPEEAMPERGVAGQGVVGNWRGALVPMPGIQLRLALELSPDATGKPAGVLVSIDQGNARIPISGLTETDGRVHFETPSVQGAFTGTMNADGSEISGEWTQLGRTTPLVFKRLPATSAP
jgi:hypothetical protein